MFREIISKELPDNSSVNQLIRLVATQSSGNGGFTVDQTKMAFSIIDKDAEEPADKIVLTEREYSFVMDRLRSFQFGAASRAVVQFYDIMENAVSRDSV